MLLKIAKFNTLKTKVEDKSLNIVPVNNCNNKVLEGPVEIPQLVFAT